MNSEPTIFSRIINREIPADIVFEDDKVLAFRDIHPAAPVHILIIPKEPIDQISHMKAENAPLLGHMVWVATQVAEKESLNNGYRLVMNNGNEGGQSVYHIHLHLLGGRQMAWPPG
ncbi:MAG: histidine triad nucleotide-binding protein [Myxococcales bacterium]|nr:histidine triad nucleotide-binding protein [Myxococcales bacterium]